jgi:hypothetical protein
MPDLSATLNSAVRILNPLHPIRAPIYAHTADVAFLAAREFDMQNRRGE